MKKQTRNYLIEYDENNKYIEEVCNYLDDKIDSILSFFELINLKEKRKIVIWNNLDEYKNHIEQFYPYQDYMRADTNDGNINLLSLEAARKTKEHSTTTIDELKKVISHEFVHICQQDSEIEHIDSDIVWFWEGLATNLGNPEDFHKIEITVDDDEIQEFNSLENNYSIAYTIGNYMLENYSHEQILEYVRYPKKLQFDSSKILEEAKTNSLKHKHL